MQKERKLRILLLISHVVVFILIFSSKFVFCEEIGQTNLWYRYAEEYIEFDKLFHQNINDEISTEYHNLRYKAELKLLNTKQPNEDDLEELLLSPQEKDRKVALVNMMINNNFNDHLVEKIIENYFKTSNYFEKLYSIYSFRDLDKNKILTFESGLFAIMTIENNEELLIKGMPLIIQMDESKAIYFFANNLKKDSKMLRNACYVYLRKTNKKILEEVKSLLLEENAGEALNFINEAESERKGSGVKPEK